MTAAPRRSRTGSTGAAGPTATSRSATFRYADPDRRLVGVRLQPAVRIPGAQLDFTRLTTGWRLKLPRPPVDRMEYLLELRHADGGRETVLDPANDKRAPGAFGDKSVIEFPGYVPPAWLGRDGPCGPTRWLSVPTRGLAAPMSCLLWSCAGLVDGTPAPLLVVHDGPEFARLGELTQFLDAMTGAGRLPPMRAALLAPLDRDEHYSGSAAYARALALGLLPTLERVVPTPAGGRSRVGLGVSLGAVGMLHAQRRYPAAFGGLFLQSGSFFSAELDPQEASYSRFTRVTRFVTDVLRSGTDGGTPVPTAMTCGSVEDNLENNRRMSRSLGAQGYGAQLRVHPDAHNWVSWRDVLDPCLVDLLAHAWA